MNTEKINAAAKRHASTSETIFEEYDKETAFKAGIHFAAENPSVIGCVTVEEAMRFAEWVFEMDWIYDFGDKWSSNDGHYKTTAELFDIYKQQKP